MYEDKFVQPLKQVILGYLLIIFVFGKQTLNILNVNEAQLVILCTQPYVSINTLKKLIIPTSTL
jgi:hypothetical protein